MNILVNCCSVGAAPDLNHNHKTQSLEAYALHPKPFMLFPKPYTVKPKPYTLNPTWRVRGT